MADEFMKDPIERGVLGKLFPDVFDSFSHTADGKYVFLINLTTDYCYLSDEAVDYFGLPSNRIYGVIPIWGNLICEEDRGAFFEDVQNVLDGITDEHNLTYRMANKFGEYVTCSCKGRIIKDEAGTMKYFAGTVVNHQRNDIVDPVTGLYNINYLFAKMKIFKEAERPYYLLITGLRSFFEINSAYGYDFGNRVLREITKIIRTFAEGGMIYRTEGTKVVFLFKDNRFTVEDIKKSYESIMKTLKSGIFVDGQTIRLDLCGALLVSNNHILDMNTVYNSALFALDKVKKEKISELMVVDDKLFSGNQLFLKKLNHIRNCIIRNCEGFYLEYQPIVSTKTSKLCGMEALLRWEDEEYGKVSPGEFIEWLEKDPLFYELGKWIIEKALIDSKPIVKLVPDFIVNINLSYPQLQTISFKNDVVNLVEKTGFSFDNLELELTERCKLIDVEALRNDMNFFKSKGIKIALDDLGTGYSALDLMVELPIDQIKIDRSLVLHIDEDTSRQSLLRAITACAKELNKGICVEGMETEELADFVRSNFFVTSMQGYYYSKPKKIEDVIKMIEAEK